MSEAPNARKDHVSTLGGILIGLRGMLMRARESNDTLAANDLFTTLDLLLEASYDTPNRQVSGILQQLKDSARDTLQGVEWKSTIPSVEDILASTTPG